MDELICPECGENTVVSTDVVDAGWMQELFVCRECKFVDTVDAFEERAA